MSKSFCKFGLANGSVDDDDATDAVSGNAIDGGELINNLDATISIRFSATGNRIGRLLEAAAGIGVAAVAAAVVVVVVVVAATDDVKFGNRWLCIIAGVAVIVAIEAVEAVAFTVVGVDTDADVAVAVAVAVASIDGNVELLLLFGCCVVVADAETTDAARIPSIAGLVTASNIKNDKRKSRVSQTNENVCENV